MKRILIAEDEARIATFVQKGLNAEGYVTHVVTDGQSAYEEARSYAYDLLILDIGLPVMDGLSVLHRLRQDLVDIPVLILSARSSVEDKVAGLGGGADDYLRKPFIFTKEELVEPMDPKKRIDISKRQPAAVLKFKENKHFAHNR